MKEMSVFERFCGRVGGAVLGVALWAAGAAGAINPAQNPAINLATNAPQNSSPNAQISAPNAPQNLAQNGANSNLNSPHAAKNGANLNLNSNPTQIHSNSNLTTLQATASLNLTQDSTAPANHSRPLDAAESADFLHGFDIASNFALSTLYQNYFLPATYTKNLPDNRQNVEAKFQISIKKALLSSLTPLDETWYFGYTQTSWWQIYDNSGPFRESNYAPEFFVHLPTKTSWREESENALVRAFRGVQLGVIHQSNGRGGAESRSWNRVFASAHFSSRSFDILPKIWWRIPDSVDDNPDISDYKGRGEVLIHYRAGRQILGLRVISNLRFDRTARASFELEWAFPLFSSGIYCYAQYFNGYGESMIDYNKHINRIGLGFLLLQ